ncbi:oxygen-independent coproporphyrinogen III oxidase [Pedobacter nyackensis]|uniref:oxygen-independent coproporphyrinogen III oxidase n=1 Tax=Pedobacter nyackensis TaxID=475255 RepID=UPI00292D9946|nr:oxygen-independent coproporphyrinogen III oxidase [Pedobacter nyackensis]
MNTNTLIEKYHVAAPRYTSYPTVPYWDEVNFNTEKWSQAIANAFKSSNSKDGISVYIHLPFCEDLCTYCGCNTRITKNHKVEEPYINALLKEWDLYLGLFKEKPVLRELHLGGGTPTFFSPRNLDTLIRGILAKATLHEDAEFSFEAHPGNTTEAHLFTLNRLGFRRLSLGIQDFDPVVQLAINRMQSVEQVEAITALARKTGYNSINYDLIYGLPNQTFDGLSDTIYEVLRLKPDRIAFYSYAHVPWVRPGQRRYTEDDLPSPESKRELYELGRKLLKENGYVEIGMDHFTLVTDSLYKAEKEGRLHRNFMGYTHQYSAVMVSLGVSSISDTWTAFAQNVKTVENYMEMVNAGEFPVVKGHILTETDLLIRKHILNIMCQGHTSWTVFELENESFASGIERMRWLAQDGLIILSPNGLQVTGFGKRFLRNICMNLDARLWNKQPEKQLFSLAD